MALAPFPCPTVTAQTLVRCLPALCLRQVGELSASRASVYSGGGAVNIKRLFGLTVDVLSAGGPVSIGSVYADRAAVSTAGPAAAAAAGTSPGVPSPSTGIGQRAAAAAVASGGGSGGRLHVGHIACLKGEARLESGGAPLEVDGLEGNAALLSSGGNIKVRLWGCVCGCRRLAVARTVCIHTMCVCGVVVVVVGCCVYHGVLAKYVVPAHTE